LEEGKLTCLQAIIQAGGFKNTAKLKNIVILRNQGTEKPLFITINLKADLKKHAQHNDILLKPYDVVFVPKTFIAKLNQFVDQYIRQLIPVTTTVGFSYVLWVDR
jgi:protein involved in polysaccharide export with SLBB domain